MATAPTIPERAPDYYAKLIRSRPTDAPGILATLCRRKDFAIRQCLKAHADGFNFDDAIKPLAAVFQRKEAKS